MRLFVAVELDAAVLSAAEQAVAQLRDRLDRALQARWISTTNMHLTVRFIGHVAGERAPAVLNELEPPLAIPPFDVTLEDCGVFPPSGPPRVIWIGLKDGLPSLRAMHDQFNHRLQPLGFEPESRPYSAHLTLARIKDAPRGSAASVRDAIRAVGVPQAQCRISAATVFESRLTPNGSIYTSVLHVPLSS